MNQLYPFVATPIRAGIIAGIVFRSLNAAFYIIVIQIESRRKNFASGVQCLHVESNEMRKECGVGPSMDSQTESFLLHPDFVPPRGIWADVPADGEIVTN